jgi:hypothetical protein
MIMIDSNSVKYAFIFCLLIFPALNSNATEEAANSGLRLSTFDLDATPPVGSQLAYQKMENTWDMSLRARGVVIMGSGQPIILLSVDWIGISNDSQDAFKTALADAVGTIPERIAVHTVHQHDAPISDFGAERILKDAGLDPLAYESTYQLKFINELSAAVKKSVENAQPFTHVGLGKAEVYKVASNRRIIGEDGKVRATRGSSSREAELRAEPEGLIDPMVSLISFWNNDQPIAVLSYYANHPMSYYLTGIPNPDYPGIARFMRQLAVPQALHIYFSGAGGDLGAGKYNDGSMENRLILAERLADGMKRAWEATRKEPVSASDVSWDFDPVDLPPAPFIENIQNELLTRDSRNLTNNLFKLSWLRRSQEGKKINISCLSIGSARILHMPGELTIEYQLAAKAMRPDLFVTMAAYGDYATGYICVARQYDEGGYEAGPASGVTSKAEPIIMDSFRKLLLKD